MNDRQSRIDRIGFALFLFLLMSGLYLTSRYSYALFHLLAETFSVSVAFSVFLLAWNTERFSRAGFLPLLGISSLFAGTIDLVHVLAYQGMGIFRGYDSNLPTQLWIAARYVQSLSLLAAPFFLNRPIRVKGVFAAYFGVTSLLLWIIFRGGIFPDCYIEGSGLTPFKKGSEYVISGIFTAAGVGFRLRKGMLDPRVLRFLIAAMGVMATAELLFTLYNSVTGFFNLAGHFLKIVAFYLIYRSIIETGIVRPFDLLFRELKESQESVRRSNEALEARVARRTADLGSAIASLHAEVIEGGRREEEIRLRNKELNILYNTLQATSHSPDLRDRLEQALGAFLSDMEVALGAIYLLEPEGGKLNLAAHRGIPESLIDAIRQLGPEEGLADPSSLGHGPSILLPLERPKGGLASLAGQPGWQSLHVVPISHKSDPVGMLLLGVDRTRPFSTEESRLVSAIAKHLGHAIEDARIEQAARIHQVQLIHASRMASLGKVVSGVAHEINNPNNMITFNVPMIVAAWQDAEKALEERYRKEGEFPLGGLPYSEMRQVVPKLLSGIADASRRITGIVGNLKGFARRGENTDGMVDINDVVRTAVAILRHEIMKATHHFRTDFGDGLPPVRGSGVQLEQVVMNLVMNALQSLPDPARGVRVSTSLNRDQGTVEICVADQGAGMPPEILNCIMEPFFSTKQDSGGLGIGLSICRSILQEHKGSLAFESEVGKGTRARVTLPFVGHPAGEGVKVLESVLP